MTTTQPCGDAVEHRVGILGLDSAGQHVSSTALELTSPLRFGVRMSLLVLQADEQLVHEAGAFLGWEPQCVREKVIRAGHVHESSTRCVPTQPGGGP